MRLASKASLTPLLVQWVGKRCCLLPESITTRRMQCKLQLHGRLFPCAVSMHLHPKEGRKHVQGREVWQVQPKFLMSFPSDPSNVYEVRLSGSIAHLINGRHATSHCHQVSFLALHETQPEVSWNLRRPTSSLRVYWYAVHRICIRRHRIVRIYPVKMQHVRMFLCVAGVLIV